MELKYLETVLAVARNLSFSRAAEEIPCSQASVSRQISAVEDNLGYALFERSTKSDSVRMTDRGAITISQIEELIKIYNRLFCSSKNLKNVCFTLGMFAGPFNLMAKSKIISHLYLKHPEITLTVEDVKRRSYVNMLIQGKIDGMMMYEAFLKEGEPDQLSFNNGDLSYTFLKIQYPCICFPHNHPMANRRIVSLDELRDETFLLNYDVAKLGARKEDVMHEGFLRNCEKYNFTPKIATLDMYDYNMSNVRDAVIEDRGWIYPTFQSNSLRSSDNVTFVPIRDPVYYAKYYYITLKNKFDCTAEKICRCLSELLEE